MARASAADAAFEAAEGEDREPDAPDAALDSALDSAGMEGMSDGTGRRAGAGMGCRDWMPQLDIRSGGENGGRHQAGGHPATSGELVPPPEAGVPIVCSTGVL